MFFQTIQEAYDHIRFYEISQYAILLIDNNYAVVDPKTYTRLLTKKQFEMLDHSKGFFVEVLDYSTETELGFRVFIDD